MSDSRLAELAAISAVIAAGIRLLAGLVRSIAPIENCVIFDIAPVGVHEVSAIELVQMIDSTKISGSEMKASSHGHAEELVRDRGAQHAESGDADDRDPQRKFDVLHHIHALRLSRFA